MSTSRLRVAALAAGCAVALASAPAGSAPAGRAPSAGPTARGLTCASCLLVDDTGEWLLARRARQRRANASTTKMVTALLVARRADPEARVTVSQHAAGTGGGGLDLHAGETYSVRGLLLALLLSSSNDASVALAEHVSGTEAAFVAAMNRAAPRLGARRSHFVTPHGLDRPGHFSTAADLARIAVAVLADNLLARIVRTPAATIAGPEGPLRLENRNVLLQTYRGAVGVKTGFTDRAGDVLVAAARRHGRRLIAVAMGSRDAAADCRALLDRGFALLRASVVVPARAAVGSLVFDPAGAATAAAGEAVQGMWQPASLRLSFEPEPGVHPPVGEGEAVGAVVVRSDGEAVSSVPALAASAVPAHEAPRLLEALGAVLRTAHAAARAVGLG